MFQNLVTNGAVEMRISCRETFAKADQAVAREIRVPVEGSAGERLVQIFDVVLVAVYAVDPGAGVREAYACSG